MSRPTTRSELLERIDSDFATLLRAVDDLDPGRRELPGACEKWSVKDLLAHLDAWHELLIGWEAEGRAGGMPAMPTEDLTWKQTPELNAWIWERTRNDTWDEVRVRLDDSHRRMRDIVAAYSEDDLFTKRHYRWTGTTSVASYAISASTSHYDWARGLITRYART